jgi:hypothetical protein
MSRSHFTTAANSRRVPPYRPPTAAAKKPPRQQSLFDPGPVTRLVLESAAPREPGCDDDRPWATDDVERWAPDDVVTTTVEAEGGEP